MTLTLNDTQASALRELVDSGQFASPEAFITYALAWLEADAQLAPWTAPQVAKGLASLDQGQVSSSSTGDIVAAAERAS